MSFPSMGTSFKAATDGISSFGAAFSNASIGYGVSQAPVANNTNNMTLLESIGCEIPHVNTGNAQTTQVSINTSGAHIQANVSQGAVQTTIQDCAAAKTVISDSIKGLQNTIAEATKEVGADCSQVFPQAMGDVGALLTDIGTAATASVAGLGTIAGVVGNTGLLGDIAKGVQSSGKFSCKAEAEAAIEDAIRSQAAADSSPSTQIMDAGAPAQDQNQPSPAQQVANAMDNSGCSLQDIMAIDPNNPPMALVPEFAEIDAIQFEAEASLGGLKATEEATADRAKLTMGEDDLVVNSELAVDRSGGVDCGDVANAQQSINELQGSNGIYSLGVQLVSGAATHIADALGAKDNTADAGLNIEPRQIVADNANVSMGMTG
jgi:hypothetical protein